MKTIEVTDETFDELERISEYYCPAAPRDAERAIHHLMGGMGFYNKAIRAIVYPPEDLCQICGDLIFTDKEKAQRACNPCFHREMKEI